MTAAPWRQLLRTRAAAANHEPARPAALYAYTAAVIVAGFGALLLATALVPLGHRIALPLPGDAGPIAGLALWIVFGLAGAARIIRNPSGNGVLTFHLPFIVAAMALGGPVAGAWVGVLSTFDRHELEEAPWYGILANHATFALAAVVGGLAMQWVSGLAGATDAPWSTATVDLLAILLGTALFTIVSVGLAVGTIVLRGGHTLAEALSLFNGSYRRTTVAETILGWLLALVYVTVGWWAPIACAALVLALWQANADQTRLATDSLTGLLNKDGFRFRLAETMTMASRGGPGGAVAFLDLNDFGQLNHRVGYQVADEVLVHVAQRIRATIRATDSGARLMGDEFAVIYPGVTDPAIAGLLARRLHAALDAPYATSAGLIDDASASVGMVLFPSGERPAEATLIEDRAAKVMMVAKHRDKGVAVEGESIPPVSDTTAEGPPDGGAPPSP